MTQSRAPVESLHERARPPAHERPRTTDHARVDKMAAIFAVHVGPPCERLNTNFHSIIRLANWGDLGSFCVLILLIHDPSYRRAMICCTMLHMLFSLLYILDTMTNDLKINMTYNGVPSLLFDRQMALVRNYAIQST